jgi:hypothetical protein
MSPIIEFSIFVACIFVALGVAAVITRLAYAVTEKIAQAPLLDGFVSVFTWIPWVIGGFFGGWVGLVAAVLAQILFLHAFCLIHRALRGRKGRTLTDAQGRVLGPVRNQLCLLVQTPAIFLFVAIRVAELLLYPLIAALGRLPTYRQSEWVNLSRHKYDGLIGYDLLWCWYCDWMTGLWCLGSEMLRNIESFWCPIQFQSPIKNRNAAIDFPDAKEWAPPDGTMEDAVRLIEKHYDKATLNRWWGHSDRAKVKDDGPEST